MRVSGTAGALRVGYQRAAAIGAWSIQLEPRLPRAYTFRGTLQAAHAYWIAQRPLDLVLAVGTTEWLWRDVALDRQGAEVTIDLRERPIISERVAMPAQEEQTR